MYNSTVSKAFSFSTADSMRYGSTVSATPAWWRNRCSPPTRARASSRSPWAAGICISTSTAPRTPRATTCSRLCPQLDTGVGQLLSDLSRTACSNDTLMVMVGEFGRTVGPVTAALGRDHLAAAVDHLRRRRRQGRQSDRPTLPDGSDTLDFGWTPRRPAQRYVRPRTSKPPSTRPSASTGPPNAATTPLAAASSTSRQPTRCSTGRSTSSGGKARAGL